MHFTINTLSRGALGGIKGQIDKERILSVEDAVECIEAEMSAQLGRQHVLAVVSWATTAENAEPDMWGLWCHLGQGCPGMLATVNEGPRPPTRPWRTHMGGRES